MVLTLNPKIKIYMYNLLIWPWDVKISQSMEYYAAKIVLKIAQCRLDPKKAKVFH